jgi:hypothetical protein
MSLVSLVPQCISGDIKEYVICSEDELTYLRAGYAAKFKTNEGFKYFFAIYVQQAWAARETLAFQDDERLPVPRIVSKLRQGVESNTGERVDVGNDWATNTICVDPPYSMIPQLETPLTMDLSMTQFGWPALNWDMSGASSW